MVTSGEPRELSALVGFGAADEILALCVAQELDGGAMIARDRVAAKPTPEPDRPPALPKTCAEDDRRAERLGNIVQAPIVARLRRIATRARAHG